MNMALQQLALIPGICKVQSDYSNSQTAGFGQNRQLHGRYTDGNHIRFVAGYPEKVKGFTAALSTKMTGVPRSATDFHDKNNNPMFGIGTDNHLYVYNGSTLTDVTPRRTIFTGTLTNAITTVSGSTTVAIADSSQTLINLDWVFLSAASAVGGVTLNGWYQVSGRSGTGYNITVPSAASSSAGPAGGTLTVNYPTVTLGANPFATTNLSTTVTVTHTAHGASTGDYVTFVGATTFAGIPAGNFNTELQLTVVNANSYTVVVATQANSSTSGGGSAVQVQYDITQQGPTTLTAVAYGKDVAGNDVVYGIGPYGYGVSSVTTNFSGWTLAPYGNQMLACPIGGTIYIYNSVQGGRGYPLLNAPPTVLAMFVTPERFVVALGASTLLTSGNQLNIEWADQVDYTVWTSLATNTALSGRQLGAVGGYLVCGLPVSLGTSLAFTNRNVFGFFYNAGSFEIYSTPMLSDASGAIGPFAATTLGGIAFWMSDHDFWTWNGAVSPLPSDDIRDYVFSNLNVAYQWKCVAATNRAKKEIWFFYPSVNSTENDSYVIYHTDQPGSWSIGQPSTKFARSMYRDSELFPTPLAADKTGQLYIQETTSDANGLPVLSQVTWGPVDISNGSANMDIFGFIQDFQRIAGQAFLNILIKDYPSDAYVVDGPITLTSGTERIDLRDSGKMVAGKIFSNGIGSDWRLGAIRIDYQPAGSRS